MLGVRWRTHSSASCEATYAPSFGITVCRCSTWTIGHTWAEACTACLAGPQMHQARYAERQSQFLSQVVPEHQPLMPSNVFNFSPGFLYIAAAECPSACWVIRAFLDNLQNVCGKGKLCRFKGCIPEYLPTSTVGWMRFVWMFVGGCELKHLYYRGRILHMEKGGVTITKI